MHLIRDIGAFDRGSEGLMGNWGGLTGYVVKYVVCSSLNDKSEKEVLANFGPSRCTWNSEAARIELPQLRCH